MDEEKPFRIGILGDFSGRVNRRATGALQSVAIDPENFEQVMDRVGVALELPAGMIRFRELDDFHPDQLYRAVPLFGSIREAKKQLSTPQTFRGAGPPPAPPTAPAPASPAAFSESLLDQIAGESASAPAPAPVSARDESSWDEAIRRIAAKHAVPGRDPRQEEMLAVIDQTAAAQMRAILGHPDFQAIEAAWRSIFFLFRYVESGVDLQVHLIDVSKAELVERQAELAKLMASPAIGDRPWSLLVGLYTFTPDERDCALLARLGALARQARAPFLGSVDSRLFGCGSIAASPDPDDWKDALPVENARAWQQLRRSPDADWIGVAFPRFLLRLPYGEATSPAEAFDFEEMPGKPSHEAYLWGNPAVACACMLAAPGGPVNRLDGIPIHNWARGEATPQAEIWMTERFASKIADAGVLPLASVKHSDAIQLVRLQSIADPPRPLAGAW